MALSRKGRSWAVVLIGLTLLSAGAALLAPAAGLIVAGGGLIAIGLLAFDVDESSDAGESP